MTSANGRITSISSAESSLDGSAKTTLVRCSWPAQEGADAAGVLPDQRHMMDELFLAGEVFEAGWDFGSVVAWGFGQPGCPGQG